MSMGVCLRRGARAECVARRGQFAMRVCVTVLRSALRTEPQEGSQLDAVGYIAMCSIAARCATAG